MLTLFASLVVFATLSPLALAKKQPANDNAVAAITQLENDAVKADLSGDSSFFQQNYADNWIGGFSGGTWNSKESMLADMKDSANNKMSSEAISDLKVRVYGDTAIATGAWVGKGVDGDGTKVDRRERWTDTWVKMKDGKWQCVASQQTAVKK